MQNEMPFVYRKRNELAIYIKTKSEKKQIEVAKRSDQYSIDRIFSTLLPSVFALLLLYGARCCILALSFI